MHTLLINDVPHILKLGHAKCEFLQIGTQLCVSAGFRGTLPNSYCLWWRYSSQLLLKIKMSSKHTTTNALAKGRNMSSINVMKVVGAFLNPKGMTNHSERPSLDLKTIFHTLEGSIGTWWYPNFKSIFLKYLAPLSWSRRSSICRIGYLFCTVILFSAQ